MQELALRSSTAGWREKYPSLPYILPFVCFLIFLAAGDRIGLSPASENVFRVAVMGVVCAISWPRNLSLAPRQAVLSSLVGAAVFLIWIAPDVLIPGYRNHPLFSNALVGHLHSSFSAGELRDPIVLVFRTVRAVIVVPIVEELFWRGWLMRWLINKDFERVALGTYLPAAFWITALLFASEHGPFWDVGLVTGIVYNLWMIRTKSLADCILMHAVTNALLSAYVITANQWQYWL